MIYIPQNIYYYFLHLPTVVSIQNTLQVKADLHGNSIFVFYPGLLLLFLIARKKYYTAQKRRYFLFFSGAILLGTLSFLMCYFATGWLQFGSRFFLYISPLAYILIAFVVQDVPVQATTLLLVYELTVNYLGIISLSTFFCPICVEFS